MPRLYEVSLHAAFQDWLRRAVEDVNRLDRRHFVGPELAGHLQEIVTRYTLNIAELENENITARRNDLEREDIDLWGGRRKFRVTQLDVTIPFTGDKDSFVLTPSSTTLPSTRIEIAASALKFSIPDDDSAEGAVKSLLSVLDQNLKTLRREYEQMKPQLAQAINSAAERKKQQIDAEVARDQTRSFKIVD